MNKISLKTSYIILSALASVFAVAYFCNFKNNDWLSNISLNMFTGILGTLLTVYFIDRVNKAQTELERLRIARIALKRLQIPLRNHLILMFNMGKAGAAKSFQSPDSSLEKVFNRAYFESVKYLDFSKVAPVLPEQPWHVYVQHELENLNTIIQNILNIYAFVLDFELVSYLEKVRSDGLVSYLKQSTYIFNLEDKVESNYDHRLLRHNSWDDAIVEHVRTLITIIRLYNNTMPEHSQIIFDNSFWRGDFAPFLGSARTED